ncbi:hypothetical protein [Nostoc sp. FACHB-133]|uniref:hypothetical protein n=1 Tax=Nostoc sp. FACHB-133 TaxID=2692835 RepID=UPI0016892611|nr:hypothetical protein [Nostoc sp. FACHB-133]MBD2522213.1 hypothetical protein [Nostoc sp. FACHB-133]
MIVDESGQWGDQEKKREIATSLFPCPQLSLFPCPMQYFSDKPNNLSFGLGKAYWFWGKGKFKPFPFPLSPLTEKY